MLRGDGPHGRGGGSATVPEVSAAELVHLVGTEGAPMLVDVREPDEFAGWSIPGAVNIPLGRLERHVENLVGCDQVVLVCASGARSDQATRQLLAAGLPAANLVGGMLAWAGVYDTADVDLGAATIVQVRRRGKGCLSYLVAAGGEAFVVDPSADVERYVEVAAERGWRITRVIDTHLHADHLSGGRALAAATGASLHLGAADGFVGDFEPLADGAWLSLGGATHLGVTGFATPGHTQGSVVLHVGGRAVLTGDTLFVDGVGRPDLADQAEEYARQLHRSLHAKVLALPTDAVVLPAHYGEAVAVRPGSPVASTLGALRRDLPQLAMDEEDFVAWATGRVSDRPPHYTEIVRVNRGVLRRPLEDLRRLELGPNRCAA